MLEVKMRASEMKMLVNPCSKEFISQICLARCCSYSSFGLGHALIMPLENEIEYFKNFSNDKGVVYDDNLGIIRLETKRCVAQNCKTNLCDLHYTGFKPFGCRIMPLTLKDGFVRIRGFIKTYYCQKNNFINFEKIPFYLGFKQSLVAIFGDLETDRIVREIESGSEIITVRISENTFNKVENIKKIFAKMSKNENNVNYNINNIIVLFCFIGFINFFF